MTTRDSSAMHPMAVVIRRTGLRADLIRSWERRHGVVSPARSETGRRLFTDREISRLTRMRDAVRAGWSIGQIARLGDDELRRLVPADRADLPAAPGTYDSGNGARLRSCLDAVERLDAAALRTLLDQASVDLGRNQLLDRFLVPLVELVWEACRDGRLRMAHEHFVSANVRSFLDNVHAAYPEGRTSPILIATTPAFQHHELGAQLAAAAARIEGWRTVYLGPNLPAEEIAVAVGLRGARALALSITYAGDVGHLTAELEKLGRLLPPDTALLVGGRARDAYGAALDAIGATRVRDLGQLRTELDALLARPPRRTLAADRPDAADRNPERPS